MRKSGSTIARSMSVECRSRPISLRSGPRREPVPLTRWQLAQLPLPVKIAWPLAALPARRRRAAGLRAQKLDDRRRLRFGEVAGRHRGVGNAAQDDARRARDRSSRGGNGRARDRRRARRPLRDRGTRRSFPCRAARRWAAAREGPRLEWRAPAPSSQIVRDTEDQNSQRDRGSQHDQLPLFFEDVWRHLTR